MEKLNKYSNDLNDIADVILAGGVAVIPTDTVCGVAVLFGNVAAEEKIFRIKKRSADKPLAVLVPSIDSIWEWIEKTDKIEELCNEHWPGATTFVMRAKDGTGLGIRMPDCEPVLDLMKITGPLSATSANFSGDDTPAMIKDVKQGIVEACDIVADFSVVPSGKASQVIDIRNLEEIKVLRS
jgi:tRNA threonylcarbamoyl adenosine modification protein (Sua5/YciO/YrdC/YwlC family)